MPSIGVAEYYANKTILITGGSGFIGKVLIEKLLRCCPEIKTIYLLLRKKKGLSSQERLCTLINSRCFEKIKDQNLFSKLHVVPGDINEEDLGMSGQDRSILQNEVQIVFHSAAVVSFNMGLRQAINTNVLGTKRVLELIEGMQKLEVFVDISTSFCHDEYKVLEEKVYPGLHNPQDIIECVRWMSDDMLDKIQPELIKPYVNTYGYSKNLTEDLVSQYEGKFTIAIARPSVVMAAYKEPLPGWVDNINGPTGVIYAGASGILHTTYCKEGVDVEWMPVDAAVNGVILLAYTTGLERPKNIRVCNITETGVNKQTWMEGVRTIKDYILEYPLTRCIWYPAGMAMEYRYQHKIAEFFFHIIPAYFIDLLLFLLLQKTFMVKTEKRLRKGLELLEYYSVRCWVFKNDYFRSLQTKITEEENEIFYTDTSSIDNLEFLRNYHLGVREFIGKEDLSTLPRARRHLKRLYYLHVTVVTLLCISIAYFLYHYVFVKYFC